MATQDILRQPSRIERVSLLGLRKRKDFGGKGEGLGVQEQGSRVNRALYLRYDRYAICRFVGHYVFNLLQIYPAASTPISETWALLAHGTVT